MTVRLTTAEAIRAYGPLTSYGSNKGVDGSLMVRVPTPWGIPVLAHHLVADVFRDGCDEAARTCSWRPQRIDSFVPRPIRGSATGELSRHALACAWDFFATPPNVPPPGGVWTPENPVTREFAGCFTRRGFTWGADFSGRVDLPHIEWAAAPPADVPKPSPPPVPPPPTHHGDAMTRTPIMINLDGRGGWTVVPIPFEHVVSVVLEGSDYGYVGEFQVAPDPAGARITLACPGHPGWVDAAVWSVDQ